MRNARNNYENYTKTMGKIIHPELSYKIVLEVKTKPFMTKSDYYQTKRYLTCLNKKLAILVKRILNSGSEK